MTGNGDQVHWPFPSSLNSRATTSPHIHAFCYSIQNPVQQNAISARWANRQDTDRESPAWGLCSVVAGLAVSSFHTQFFHASGHADKFVIQGFCCIVSPSPVLWDSTPHDLSSLILKLLSPPTSGLSIHQSSHLCPMFMWCIELVPTRHRVYPQVFYSPRSWREWSLSCSTWYPPMQWPPAVLLTCWSPVTCLTCWSIGHNSPQFPDT